MPKITAKESKLMNTVRRALVQTEHGLNISELLQVTRLDSVSLRNALLLVGAEVENGYWYLPAATPAETGKLIDTTQDNLTPPPVTCQAPSQVSEEPIFTNPNTGREYVEMPETGHTIKQAIVAQITESTPAKKFRNRPFTPNPIMGYQVQSGKAKIFLNRKASSRTLTLALKDLKELVNAVEKAERIA